MPKNSSDELDGTGDRTPQRGKNKNKDMDQCQNQSVATKRALGRLKNKKALARAVEGSMGTERQGDEGVDEEEEEEEDRENKRPRSEGRTAQGKEAEDAIMDG
jgi:hypothetical protein